MRVLKNICRQATTSMPPMSVRTAPHEIAREVLKLNRPQVDPDQFVDNAAATSQYFGFQSLADGHVLFSAEHRIVVVR